MIDFPALAREASALCSLVAPCVIGSRPVYVVLRSQMPHDRREMACAGYTCERLDLLLRDVIGPSWRGRGFACVVDEDSILRYPPTLQETAFFDLTLHELAHAVAEHYDWRADAMLDVVQLATESARVAACVADSNQMKPPDRLPYLFHESQFLRTVLHLTHRARLVGVRASFFGAVQVFDYGLATWSRWEDALGDEPRRSEGRSLRAVLATPPPTAFVSLWARTVTKHSAASTAGQAAPEPLDRPFGRLTAGRPVSPP